MEIKDFKEITEKHAESCQKLIKQKGNCAGITCEYCPFYFGNTVNGRGCYEYTDQEYNPETEEDKILAKNSLEFIELYNNKDIKADEKRNSIILDMNIFTMEFGKMKVSTDKHLRKVKEEFEELREAHGNYASSSFWNLREEDIEGTKYLLCSEALDMIQVSISFTSHLIEEGLMTNGDIEAWKVKLEDRKKKYLK